MRRSLRLCRTTSSEQREGRPTNQDAPVLLMMLEVRKRGLGAGTVTRLSCLSLFWHFLDVIWVCVFGSGWILRSSHRNFTQLGPQTPEFHKSTPTQSYGFSYPSASPVPPVRRVPTHPLPLPPACSTHAFC